MDDRPADPVAQPTIYNPDLLDKKDVIALFTARRGLLERLVDGLRRTAPGDPAQHVLLVGQRGQGKTTLLRRLAYAVDDDSDLAGRYLPLTFPEEQYNVAGLSDLWVNVLDALADTLSARGRAEDARRLDTTVDALPEEEAERERAARAALEAWATREGKRLLLLVDNIDIVFDRLAESHWLLRQTIATAPWVTIVGASAAMIEQTHQYGAAFYDFFRLEELRALGLDESVALMTSLANRYDAPGVLRTIENDPGRFRALQTLTGGNPRTLTLLFTILARGEGANVHDDLERLLDQSTPLYKARVEALSPQAQQIVDALATHWDPMTAAEIAEATRVAITNVSSQLSRLTSWGVVEKVPLEDTKRQGFLIAERFFNIWYLMRASRRSRRRLVWFVEFLRLFYGQAAIGERGRELLREPPPGDTRARARSAEYALALARVVGEGDLSRALEVEGIARLVDVEADVRRRVDALLDFAGEDAALKPVADRIGLLRDLRDRVVGTRDRWGEMPALDLWELLAGAVGLPPEHKRMIVDRLPRFGAAKRDALVAALERERRELERRIGSRAYAALRRAIRDGHMAAPHDVEGARAAAVALDEPALPRVAAAVPVGDLDGFFTEGEVVVSPFSPTFREVVGDVADFGVMTRDGASYNVATWFSGSTMYSMRGMPLGVDLPEAERAAKEAREAARRSPKDASAWTRLGEILSTTPGRRGDAEEAFRKASRLDGAPAEAFAGLAGVLAPDPERRAEAIEAFEAAIARDPRAPNVRYALARLYALAEETKPAAVRTLEDGLTGAKTDYMLLVGLAHLAIEGPEGAEAAEAYLRRAIKLRPSAAPAWRLLGVLALQHPDRTEEAEDAFRRAVKASRDPSVRLAHAVSLHALGRNDEAEAAFRAVLEADRRAVVALISLATLIADREGWTEEAEAFARRAVFYAPDEPGAVLALATVLAAGGYWDEAADFAERFFGAARDPKVTVFWAGVVLLLGWALANGHGAKAAEMLRAYELHLRWRPLYEALLAAEEDKPARLDRLAPEVKTPAVDLYRALTSRAHGEPGSSEPGPSSRARTRASRPRKRRT